MGNHPSSEEIIVIGIELILSEPPSLVGEAIGELDVLKDTGAIGTGASGKARDTTIHVSCGSTVEISTFQIQGTEKSIDSLRKVWVFGSSESLAGDDSAVLWVLKRCQHPFESLDGPGYIVIGENNDLGGDLGYSSGHLTSLVGLLDRHATDSVVSSSGHLGHGPHGLVEIFIDGDENDLLGFIGENGGNGAFQLIPLAIQCG